MRVTGRVGSAHGTDSFGPASQSPLFVITLVALLLLPRQHLPSRSCPGEFWHVVRTLKNSADVEFSEPWVGPLHRGIFGPSLSFTAACAAHLRHYNRACGSYFNIALQDITLSQVGNNKTEVKHSRTRPLWLCPSKGHRRRGLCNCRVQAT